MPLRPPLASRSRLLGLLLPLPLPRASFPLLVGPGLGPGPGVRPFAASASRPAKQMPPRPGINEDDVDGSYLKGSGPGGQKINKTNSAVQLIHKPTGIVVKSQETRSRSQNQKIAMRILAEKVDLLERGDQSRAAIVAETKKKRKASKAKKSRRKYRALEEEKTRKQDNSPGVDPGGEAGGPDADQDVSETRT